MKKSTSTKSKNKDTYATRGFWDKPFTVTVYNRLLQINNPSDPKDRRYTRQFEIRSEMSKSILEDLEDMVIYWAKSEEKPVLLEVRATPDTLTLKRLGQVDLGDDWSR